MTVRRLAPIAVIFLPTSLAWTVLGSALIAGSGELDSHLERGVQLPWGGPHPRSALHATIQPPAFDTQVEETKDANGRVVRTELSKRCYGPFRHRSSRLGRPRISGWSIGARGCSGIRPMRSGTAARRRCATSTSRSRRTHFHDIDFPAGSFSPGGRTRTPERWELTSAFTNLISGQTIGVQRPERLNPGPPVARVTFFAPVAQVSWDAFRRGTMQHSLEQGHADSH